MYVILLALLRVSAMSPSLTTHILSFQDKLMADMGTLKQEVC